MSHSSPVAAYFIKSVLFDANMLLMFSVLAK